MAEDNNIELLSHRVRRLYAGLASTAPVSVDSIPIRVSRAEKRLHVCQDFQGSESTDEIREALALIAYNIAHVKDPLKKHLRDKGQDAKVVERVIDSSRSLQVVIDIANREKHGYPCDRPSRSGVDPYVGEVGRSLQLKTGSERHSSAIYTVDPRTGKPAILATGGGSGAVVYWGRVHDANSVVIGDLLDYARDAIAAWEGLFSEVGIPLP